jgi:PD-(D/E)XK nuclease superfamily
MTTPPWSYSGLTSFETCAKRYYHIKVARDVKDAPGEAALWGSIVHKHLEDRVRDGTQLPSSIAGYESLVAPLLATTGTLLIEQQMAVDIALQPVEWDSPEAWCRGIVDLGLITSSGTQAMLLDWKTGKRKPDSDQLMLFAGLAFSHFPKLQQVQTSFIWLKDKKIDKQSFSRSDLPDIWQRFLPRVSRLVRAYVTASFPPKPSGLCAKYCPVGRSQCTFSGKQ